MLFRKFTLCLLAAFLSGILFTACGTAAGKQPPAALPSPSPSPSQTSIPSATPSPTPTATPTGPATYGDERQGITFAYPRQWQEKAPGVLEGSSGYAQIEYAADDGARPDAICQGEANRDKPARYGSFPEIVELKLPSFPAACLILPSSDQPEDRRGEALALVWPSAPSERLLLRADQEHIREIVESLRPGPSQSLATPQPEPCLPVEVGLAPNVIDEAGLQVDEFPAAQSSNCSPEQQPDLFNQAASAGQAAARAAQIAASQWGWARINRLNQNLAPFGVQVWASNKRFTFYQWGQLLSSRINWVGPLAMNASYTDFALPVIDSYDAGTYVMSPAGIQPQEDWNILLFDRVYPVYVGDDLISLAYDTERYPRPIHTPALLNVLKNGEVIQTLSVSGSTAAGGAARYLASWEGHWLLELSGVLVQDGDILNDRLGYSEMFAWRLVNGRPFYFYRQDGKINASYDGQTIALGYDEVIYQPLGGTAVLLQMRAYENGLTLYARRGDTWYFVTLEGR